MLFMNFYPKTMQHSLKKNDGVGRGDTVIPHEDQEAAKKIFRKKIGFLGLEVNGIIASDYGFCVTLEGGKHVSVNIYIRVTPKGIKWIEYLKKSGQLVLLD